MTKSNLTRTAPNTAYRAVLSGFLALCLLLFSALTYSKSLLAQEPNWNQGYNLNLAKNLLLERKFTEAKDLLINSKLSYPLEAWGKFYLYQISLAEFNNICPPQSAISKLKSELPSNQNSKALTLLRELLMLHLNICSSCPDLAHSISSKLKSNKSHCSLTNFDKKLVRFEALLSQQRLIEHETWFLLAKAILLHIKGETKSALSTARQLRRLRARSIPALLAKNLSSSDTSNEEIELLLLQGLQEEAWSILNKQSEKFKDLETIELSIKVLKNLTNKELLERYLTELANTKSSDLAFYERAVQGWAKNNYDNAEQALAKIKTRGSNSLFVAANVAEEQAEFTKAIKLLLSAAKLKQAEFSARAALRAIVLATYRNDIKSAKNAAALLSEILTKSSLLPSNLNEQHAMQYWAKLLGQNVNRQYDYRSYYFWRERGFFPDSLSISSKVQLAEKFCQFELASLEQYLRLSELGAKEIASLEIRARNQRTSSAHSILTRAKLHSQFGLPGLGFDEILSERAITSSLLTNCPKNVAQILYPKIHSDIFERVAKREGVEVNLLFAIARNESAFNPYAVSRTGALGLLQLMPATAKLEDNTEPKLLSAPYSVLDPEVNITLAARHIKRALNRFDGKLHLAIAAYNAGPEAVERWVTRYPNISADLFVELIPYAETKNYVKEVLVAYWIYDTAAS